MKKLISILLALVLVISSISALGLVASAADAVPTIVIPGLGQSEVKIYNEDGDLMTDSNGEELEGMFFMDTNEVVKEAIQKVLCPLLTTVATQHDFSNKFGNALGEVLGDALMGKLKSDENGNFINDVRATKYPTSLKDMSAEDREYCLHMVPLEKYAKIAGEENLYFFSYCSFGNMISIVDELAEFIESVKEQTGSDKVNLIPISQGASIMTGLLEFHPEVVDSLNKVVYIVPAYNGSDILGDIYANGLLDDDDALYGYMIPMLLEEDQEWLSYLVNLLLRSVPKDVLNEVLDTAVDRLISDYFSYSTALWGLIPSYTYEEVRDKYLGDDAHSEIRSQCDKFYTAQLNADKNVLAMVDAGVTVFDICGYNKEFYPVCDSWNKEQADGIINLSSTSMGATSAPIYETLPEDYVQANTHVGTTCSSADHNHIDSRRMVDASTGLLPDNTYYFYGLNHEKTAHCETIINLATSILTDDSYVDVYSHADKYPQFNNCVLPDDLENYVYLAKTIDTSTLSAEDAEALTEAITEAQLCLAMTDVDLDRYNAAEENLKNLLIKHNLLEEEEEQSGFMKLITKILKFFADLVQKIFGYRGFWG